MWIDHGSGWRLHHAQRTGDSRQVVIFDALTPVIVKTRAELQAEPASSTRHAFEALHDTPNHVARSMRRTIYMHMSILYVHTDCKFTKFNYYYRKTDTYVIHAPLAECERE